MTGALLVEQALEKLSTEELEELAKNSPRPLRIAIRKILYRRRHVAPETREQPLELDYDIINIENGVATLVTRTGKILTVPVTRLQDYDFIINT